MFFEILGVTGFDLSEPGPGCMPRTPVGLVKIWHTINANEKPLMFSDFEQQIALNPIAPFGGLVAVPAIR